MGIYWTVQGIARKTSSRDLQALTDVFPGTTCISGVILNVPTIEANYRRQIFWKFMKLISVLRTNAKESTENDFHQFCRIFVTMILFLRKQHPFQDAITWNHQYLSCGTFLRIDQFNMEDSLHKEFQIKSLKIVYYFDNKVWVRLRSDGRSWKGLPRLKSLTFFASYRSSPFLSAA